MNITSLTDLNPRAVATKTMRMLTKGGIESNAGLMTALGTNGPEFQTAVVVFNDDGRTYGLDIRRKSYDRDAPEFEEWEIVPCRIEAGGKP